jgi:hypothetical protein
MEFHQFKHALWNGDGVAPNLLPISVKTLQGFSTIQDFQTFIMDDFKVYIDSVRESHYHCLV